MEVRKIIILSAFLCQGMLMATVGSSPLAKEFMEGEGDEGSVWEHRGTFVDVGLICQAIQNRSMIDAVVRQKEVVNKNEMKITLSLVTLEPYAVGILNNGATVLRGNIVEKKQLKEVTVKLAEERFHDKAGQSFALETGLRNIDLRVMKRVVVVPNSKFEVPVDFNGFADEKECVQTICTLPSPKEFKSGEPHILKKN